MKQVTDMVYQEVVQYLRLEDMAAEDVADLQSIISAVILYAQRSTGKVFRQEDPLYCMAVKLLAAHWYENRNPVEIGKGAVTVPLSAGMILDHISLCGEYDESG